MPEWERYRVTAETHVAIKDANGELLSTFTVYGEAEGGSNETVDRRDLRGAVTSAVNKAGVDAMNIAAAVRDNRRRKLGYQDGN